MSLSLCMTYELDTLKWYLRFVEGKSVPNYESRQVRWNVARNDDTKNSRFVACTPALLQPRYDQAAYLVVQSHRRYPMLQNLARVCYPCYRLDLQYEERRGQFDDTQPVHVAAEADYEQKGWYKLGH